MSFSVSGVDFFESGRNPSDSLVQGLKALVVALKMWSTKGEVSITLGLVAQEDWITLSTR